jgi:hypothetical protein
LLQRSYLTDPCGRAGAGQSGQRSLSVRAYGRASSQAALSGALIGRHGLSVRRVWFYRQKRCVCGRRRRLIRVKHRAAREVITAVASAAERGTDRLALVADNPHS